MPTSLPTMTYNGVSLYLGRIVTFRQKAVYDDTGTRYQYTHFLVAVQCVVNTMVTQATAFAEPAPFDARNVRGGALPAVAIGELRRLLLSPRKKLRLFLGSETMLESPQRTSLGREMETDANNGPNPISFDVDTILGQQTILATFTIETWLNECYGRPGAPPPILISHSYEMEEDIDEDYFSTRHISGRATFRTDFLRLFTAPDGTPIRPDDYRPSIFHPVPDTYQRTHVNVKATGDGTSLVYRITDELRNWGLEPGRGIIRCEGRLKRGYDWTGWTNPSMYWDYSLSVVGYPDTQSVELVRALVRIYSTMQTFSGARLMDRLRVPPVLGGFIAPPVPGLDRTPMHAADIEVQFPKRYASLHVRQNVSGIVGMGGVLEVMPGLDMWDYWPENGGEWFGPHVDENASLQWNGSTTDTLISLVSQMLNDPCASPVVPTVPRVPLNINPHW